ncbi:MAG: GDSL-type esterase/lipase family protein [Bacteroidia bacterium]
MKKPALFFLLIAILAALTACKENTDQSSQASALPPSPDAAAYTDTLRIFTFEREPAEPEKTIAMPWGVRLEGLLADLPVPLKIDRYFYSEIPLITDISLPAKNPVAVVLDYGLNEAWIKNANPQAESQMSLPEFRNRLWQLAKSFADKGTPVVLVTPNPVDIPANTSQNDRMDTYSETIREIANSLSLPVVDTQGSFSLYATTPGNNLSDLLTDGKYPNDIGHAIIAEDIAATLGYLLSSNQ